MKQQIKNTRSETSDEMNEMLSAKPPAWVLPGTLIIIAGFVAVLGLSFVITTRSRVSIGFRVCTATVPDTPGMGHVYISSKSSKVYDMLATAKDSLVIRNLASGKVLKGILEKNSVANACWIISLPLGNKDFAVQGDSCVVQVMNVRRTLINRFLDN